ncbi:MAG: hypothetical protein L3J51_04970 [Cocleimonas sp.]|nr:hypothetical protein [Cocleimonas sp.]
MRIIIFTILSAIPVLLNATNHEIEYKGIYSWGAEVHSFKPCGSKKSYWVSYDWAGIKMHEHYISTAKKPYQLMYVEFRGQVLNEVVDGFAKDYAGLVRISEVSEYTFRIPVQCK